MHHPDHPRWLLAFLIDWHHREEKANWWEFFRLQPFPKRTYWTSPKPSPAFSMSLRPFLSKKPTGSTVHGIGFRPRKSS